MSELRTNKIVPRDGLPSGAIGGGIIQVVRAQSTTSNQTPSADATWTDVQPTVTITPTRSSNLIIIETSVMCIANNNAYVGFRLLRGSTAIREWWGYQNDGSYTPFQGPGKHIDSPSTTSAVTYKTQGQSPSDGGTRLLYNYNWQTESTSLDNLTGYGTRSTMILMEVSA